MIYYAKSDTRETIKAHTEQVLLRLQEYKRIYGRALFLLSERDWQLLEIAVKYHDVGKADLFFQNKIRKKIGEKEIEVVSQHDVPHNFLSVMAIPFKDLGLNKEEQRLVSQVVAFHHERNIPIDEIRVAIVDHYKKHFLPYKQLIEDHLGLNIDEKVRASKLNALEYQNRIRPDDPLYYRYVLLKGLLHRFDHAASADVPIELATEMNIAEYVNHFFKEKLKKEKNFLQRFAEEHQNDHVVVVAQTGMGKTEAGLLWLGASKGFFTLPLRVSINAMYSRITDEENVGFSKREPKLGEVATGLLHSTSLDYLYSLYDNEEANDVELEKVHSHSKEFANKLIITTIDQILKFPFYYLGFEKEFATMATAKVIIDELQAYDPKIAALLIRALKLIDKIGGSFMIMTATLPDFYLQTLKRELGDSRIPLVYKEFIDDSVKRHHIRLRDCSILDEEVITEMEQSGKKSKVLVICNTVDRAREVYDALDNRGAQVKLLHARFTKRDRSRLEKQIIDFAKSNHAGIWVTTQLVEASLDIDFDLLYTEMSTLDSQFQRYGRVNRKGSKSVERVNIQIMTQDVSGVSKDKRSIYHHDIYERSLSLLKQHKQGLLLESSKLQMIKELYDGEQLEGSSFKKEFIDTLQQLKNRPHYDLERKEAQDLLRDIQQVQVIPRAYFHDPLFKQCLEEWKKAATKEEKRKKRIELEGYSVSVNKYRAEKIGISPLEGIKGLYVIACDYSSERGLLTNNLDLFD